MLQIRPAIFGRKFFEFFSLQFFLYCTAKKSYGSVGKNIFSKLFCFFFWSAIKKGWILTSMKGGKMEDFVTDPLQYSKLKTDDCLTWKSIRKVKGRWCNRKSFFLPWWNLGLTTLRLYWVPVSFCKNKEFNCFFWVFLLVFCTKSNL